MKGIMKKTYSKPVAAVEFYKLSQSIAACAIKISYLDNACVVQDNDTPVQMRSYALLEPLSFTAICSENVFEIQDNDTLCIHTQVAATFTS